MDMSLLLLLLVIATFIVPNHAFDPFGLKGKIDGFNKRTKGEQLSPWQESIETLDWDQRIHHNH